MNINRALIVSLFILILLTVATVVNLNNSKSPTYSVSEYRDDEAFMINVQCVPEIVRSYESVKEVYGKKNILFFRYVNNSCNSCVDSQLNELLNFQEEIGKEHIWVFPAYPNDRNSKIQLSNELAKYNYRNIPADSLLVPTYEGEQKSYFAWINGEGEIDMVFVPDRSNVHHTRKYFLEVKKRIQNLGEN